MNVDEGEEGFLSLETIETWIVYVYHSEGEWARPNISNDLILEDLGLFLSLLGQ